MSSAAFDVKESSVTGVIGQPRPAVDGLGNQLQTNTNVGQALQEDLPLIDAYKIAKYNSYDRKKLLEVLPPAVVTLFPQISKEQALKYLIWGSDPQSTIGQSGTPLSGLVKIERLTRYNLLSPNTRQLIDILYGDGVTFASSSPTRLTSLLLAYDDNLQFADNVENSARDLGINFVCSDRDEQVELYDILKNYLTAERDKSSMVTISQAVAMSRDEFAQLAPEIDYESRTDYVAQKYYNLF